MKLFSFITLIVVVAILTQEGEARRKILKGRKTVTRTYVSDAALPAWAYCVLVAIGELFFGGILYLIMKKRILDTPLSGAYALSDRNPSSKY